MAFVNFLSNFTNGLFRHFVSFEKFHSPVGELIHLARCVKFNPYFIPGIVLIVFCGTHSNRRTNFIPRLAGFNSRLALIVFSGTGARTTIIRTMTTTKITATITTNCYEIDNDNDNDKDNDKDSDKYKIKLKQLGK